MNNCRRHQETISLLVAGLCPEADKRRAHDHLPNCPDCRAYYRELTEITGSMARLKKSGARALPSAELRARWTDQILAGTPERQTNPGKPAVSASAAWFPTCRPWLTWGLATAACVLLAFYIGYRHGQMTPADPLENLKLIRETLAMFPNRIRSIVEDKQGLNLVLSDHDDVPVSSPLYIRVCDGKQCSSFLTFSGQEITVAGQKMTVLEDAQGGVILAGHQFVWSTAGPKTAIGTWQIEARNLGAVSM